MGHNVKHIKSRTVPTSAPVFVHQLYNEVSLNNSISLKTVFTLQVLENIWYHF